ncbi:MAG: hypothetical protein ACRCXN_11605 [Bacteroidales bacterium]
MGMTRSIALYVLFVMALLLLSCNKENKFLKKNEHTLGNDSIYDHYVMIYKSGRNFQSQKSFKEAITEFDQCVRFESDSKESCEKIETLVIDAMTQLLNTYQSDANPEGCVTYFTTLSKQPTDFIRKYCMRDVYSFLGYALSRTERVEDAEKVMKAALDATYPNPTPARYFRDNAYAAAVYYSNPTKQSEVIAYCQEAIKQAQLYDNPSGLQWITSLLGGIYKKTGKIDAAADLFLESMQEARRQKDFQGESNAYNSLTDLYLYWNLPEYANNYASLSLLCTAVRGDNPMVVGLANCMKARVMSRLGYVDSTLWYLQKADSCNRTLPYNSGMVDIDLLWGTLMVDHSSGDSLQGGMDRLLCVVEKGTPGNRSKSFYQLARGYKKQGKSNETESMLDSMYHLLQMSESPVYIENAYKFALDHYINKDDAAKIKQYASAILEEINFKHDTQTSRRLADVVVQFQTEKKEQQLLMTQIELENKNLHLYIYIILSIGVLLFVLVFFLYKRRLYLKKQQLMELRLLHLLDNLEAEKENKNNIEQQLSEILTEKDSRIEIEAVTPGLLKEKGEPKFRQRFEQLYPLFLPKLKERVPNIGHKEELLCMLIVLGQDTMQIQTLMGIARSSVNMARYRLRQKMNLDKDINLDDYIKGLLE